MRAGTLTIREPRVLATVPRALSLTADFRQSYGYAAAVTFCRFRTTGPDRQKTLLTSGAAHQRDIAATGMECNVDLQRKPIHFYRSHRRLRRCRKHWRKIESFIVSSARVFAYLE
uniref:Uncharacterized protein n=1 Tax=Peronospora matthiolae TaxID=2874970 RepID=A0AAV1T3E5_9STRA